MSEEGIADSFLEIQKISWISMILDGSFVIMNIRTTDKIKIFLGIENELQTGNDKLQTVL